MGNNINQTPKRDTFSLFQASFFGRGGGAGAMFRRGMSTLLRVEGGRGIHRHRAGATANAQRVNYLHYFISKFD